MTQQLWHQKYTTQATAQDALDIFIHDVGAFRVISEAIFQAKDDQWVALCRYRGEMR